MTLDEHLLLTVAHDGLASEPIEVNGLYPSTPYGGEAPDRGGNAGHRPLESRNSVAPTFEEAGRSPV